MITTAVQRQWTVTCWKREIGIRPVSYTHLDVSKRQEDTWISAFDQYDYKLDVQKCVDMFPYGVQSVNNASRPNWKTQINDLLLKIYSCLLYTSEIHSIECPDPNITIVLQIPMKSFEGYMSDE